MLSKPLEVRKKNVGALLRTVVATTPLFLSMLVLFGGSYSLLSAVYTFNAIDATLCSSAQECC